MKNLIIPILFFLSNVVNGQQLIGLEFSDISDVEFFKEMKHIDGGYESFEIPHEIFIMKKNDIHQVVVVTEVVTIDGKDLNRIIDTLNIEVKNNQRIFFGKMTNLKDNTKKYRIVLLERKSEMDDFDKVIMCWIFLGSERKVIKEEEKSLYFGSFSDY